MTNEKQHLYKAKQKLALNNPFMLSSIWSENNIYNNKNIMHFTIRNATHQQPRTFIF